MMTMSVKTLVEILERMPPEADVAVAINGCLFAIAATSSDSGPSVVSPRVSLQLGNAYDYRLWASQDQS